MMGVEALGVRRYRLPVSALAKNKMKSIILFSIFALFTFAVHADPARKLALIKEVLALTDVKGTLEKARVDNVSQTRKVLVQQVGEKASNPMMVRLVDRAMEKYSDYSKEIFDYSKKESFYLSFYDESFSEQELEGLVTFYKTDAGRALIRAQPQLALKMQQALFQNSAERSARVDRIMKETVAEMTEEFKQQGKAP